MFSQRRRRAMVVAVALAVTMSAAVSGCSASTPSQPLGTKNPKGTVQFWDRSVVTPWSKQVVAEFNKTHKNLQVKLTSINDAQLPSKLATALRTSNVPDLVTTDDVDGLPYIDAGNFADLTSELGKTDLKDILSPPQLDLATVDDKVYGTPAVLDASVLLYNKKLFKQAGIDAPPASLDEMLEDARKIRALGPDTYGFYFAGACSGCLTFTVMPNLYAEKADLFTGDDLHAQTATVEENEALKSTLEFYQKVWSEGLAPKGVRSDTGTSWPLPFQKGNIGMAPLPLGGYATATAAQKADIGIAPLPGVSGGVSTYIGGANFGIPKKAKNAAGAWEFIKFALSKKAQELAPSAGFAPVRTDLVSDAAFTKANPSVVPGLEAAVTGSAPRTLYHNQLYSLPAGPWQKMFTKAVFGGDIDEAMEEGQSGFAAVLKGDG